MKKLRDLFFLSALSCLPADILPSPEKTERATEGDGGSLKVILKFDVYALLCLFAISGTRQKEAVSGMDSVVFLKVQKAATSARRDKKIVVLNRSSLVCL